MARLPVYVGSHRRQIGGSIFGNGFRTAIPALFQNTIKPVLARLGKRIGTHVLQAGVGAASDMLKNKITSREGIKEIFKTHAKDQMNALKRNLLFGDDDEERQAGGRLKRRKVVRRKKPVNKRGKSAKKFINKRKMPIIKRKRITKKSSSKRGKSTSRRVHKQKRRKVINKSKKKQSW